jgi:hypothetical protein
VTLVVEGFDSSLCGEAEVQEKKSIRDSRKEAFGSARFRC